MEDKSRTTKDKVLKILLIIFGIVIVLDYPLFNLMAYMDASREVLELTAARVWVSMGFGIALFIARAAFFCMEVSAEDGKVYRIGTWVLQGFYAVLCILSVVVLAWFTKGAYVRETVFEYVDFKDVLAFLTVSQGMIQRIFRNGLKLTRLLKKDPYASIASYVFKLIVCGLILYLAHKCSWYWCDKWIRLFLKMIGA